MEESDKDLIKLEILFSLTILRPGAQKMSNNNMYVFHPCRCVHYLFPTGFEQHDH